MPDLNQNQYEISRFSLDSPNFTGGLSKFSRIAAPLTSMLKTSSIKSAEPRKGVVGFDGSGKNRAGPAGKHKVDGVDGVEDDSCCSSERKFHLRLQYGSRATHLNAQDKLINGLINSRKPKCGQVMR